MWTESHRIKSISPPEPIQDPRSRKRFKIRMQYLNAKGDLHSCTIRFGDKRRQEFIDHHSSDKRAMDLLKLKGSFDSPLHHNYWRVLLLNTAPTIEEAWKSYLASHDILKMR